MISFMLLDSWKHMSAKVYGFIGLNGSGKHYRAEIVQKETGADLIDFSDGVRDYTFSFLGWFPSAPQEYEEFKERSSILKLGGEWRVRNTGRDFLDNVGKKMRDFDPNFWANYARDKALESENDTIIFSSCRYDNELQAVADYCHKKHGNFMNLTLIFCDYRSEKYDETPKEYQEFALMLRDKHGCKDGDDVTDLVLMLLSEKTKING